MAYTIWEGVLRKVILPELEKGRPNWDRPHTEAVVYWTRQLLQGFLQGLNPRTKNPEVESAVKGVGLQGLNPCSFCSDEKVMVTAAYAHDWGYIGLFPEGTTYDEIQRMKPKHMEVGAEKIGELLRERLSNEFSKEQIERVVHLVRIHDKLGKLKNEDELMLMEADTLGALDIDRVKPTFSKADNEKYMSEVYRKRRSRFVHKKAIEWFEELIEKREGYYV